MHETVRGDQAYQSDLARKVIVRQSSIYCVVGDKEIRRDEWESWIGEAHETLRRRGDCGTQSPLSIEYAFLRDVRVVKERGTQRGVICFIHTDLSLGRGMVDEARCDVGYVRIPIGTTK